MTKQEFFELQDEVSASDKTLKDFLQEKGICYSTYNYWRKKFVSIRSSTHCTTTSSSLTLRSKSYYETINE